MTNIGNHELFSIDGDGQRPIGSDLPSSSSALRPAFEELSIKTYMDVSRSPIMREILERLIRAAKEHDSYLVIYNCAQGEFQYLAANTYDEIIENNKWIKNNQVRLQMRHIFKVENPLSNDFTLDEVRKLKTKQDILEKFRSLEIARTGKCRFTTEDDVFVNQPETPEESVVASRKITPANIAYPIFGKR